MRKVLENFIQQWKDYGNIVYVTEDESTVYRYDLYITDNGTIVLEETSTCKDPGCVWLDPIVVATGIEAVLKLLRIVAENAEKREESYRRVEEILSQVLSKI